MSLQQQNIAQFALYKVVHFWSHVSTCLCNHVTMITYMCTQFIFILTIFDLAENLFSYVIYDK